MCGIGSANDVQDQVPNNRGVSDRLLSVSSITNNPFSLFWFIKNTVTMGLLPNVCTFIYAVCIAR